MKAIVWFQNDLRLHDQAALMQAVLQASEVLPIYCFDPRHFERLPLGFPKTGSFRAQFLLEAVADLRKNLQRIGGNLLVAVGKPEEVIPFYAKLVGATSVYASQETTNEEVAVAGILQTRLSSQNVSFKSCWQSTLFHKEDLPFSVGQLPDIFTQFRKRVESGFNIRKVIAGPAALRVPIIDDWGQLPTLAALGLDEMAADPRHAMAFEGGETAGMARIASYFWESNALASYKETRNGLLGEGYSSKFSPWLALGCLSPRFIYEEIRLYEKDRVANDSTYWLIFELLWRDYFRFVAEKYGTAIFKKGGIMGVLPRTAAYPQKFSAWMEGTTGNPFIDANMRELRLTGFMSNRGRQNVASFLVKDLGVHWWHGAAYFESALLDYDPCSNWGNWNYVAGVGNDPRENRYFNIRKQAERYDPQAHYMKHWLPHLHDRTAAQIHDML